MSAPSFARRMHVSFPSPVLPPVTITVRPVRSGVPSHTPPAQYCLPSTSPAPPSASFKPSRRVSTRPPSVAAQVIAQGACRLLGALATSAGMGPGRKPAVNVADTHSMSANRVDRAGSAVLGATRGLLVRHGHYARLSASNRRLALVWRRWIHAATDTVVRRPHRRLPGDRLARLDLLARRRLAEEAPGRTAPKLRGAHARNSAQGVLMRRQTWRTPDVTAPPRPMVRNAAGWDRSQPAWRLGTIFFKQSYSDHECSLELELDECSLKSCCCLKSKFRCVVCTG